MAGLVRSTNSSPIREFIYIPGNDVLDAVNSLVADINQYLSVFSLGLPVNTSTMSGLPFSAPDGTKWFVTDGQKIGEVPGAGTGIWAEYSAGAWRTISTDAPLFPPYIPPPPPPPGSILTESSVNVLTEDGGRILTES